MNHDTIINIVVTMGIAFSGTIIAFLSHKITKLEKRYAPTLEKIESKIKEEIGDKQYNEDVQVIQNAINELNVDKKYITIEIATEIIKKVAKNVHFNETEILEIINKIIQGVL